METAMDYISRPSPRHRCLAALLMGCTALVALPMGAVAQDGAEEDGSFRLSPIIVDVGAASDDDANSVVVRELWVGGKVATSILDTPASVSVVTQREIAQRNATTTEEVLQYSAGIVTDYYGSDDRNDYFLVRGFQASTYRDGLTLGSMRDTREEPYAFERVEVLKGANSTLFGVSDPGGSVNFVTKTPRFERFGEIYGQVGSHDQKELGFDFGDTLNPEGTLAYRLTGKVQDSALEYDHSRNDDAFLMGGLSWAPTDDTTVTVTFDHLKRDATPNSGGYPIDREYDREDFFGEPDFNDHDVKRDTLSTMVRHDFGGGLSLSGNLRYTDLKNEFAYIYINDSVSRVGTSVPRSYFGTDTSAEEVIGNAILQYDASFGTTDSSTLLGFEFRDATIRQRSIFGTAVPIDIANPVYSGAPANPALSGVSNNDYKTKSLFVQQNFSFDDRIIATVGLRHDWLDLASKGISRGKAFDSSDEFSETSVRAALTYKVTDEVSAYVSYAESVAPPTIGVEPQRGDQYELGVKYQPEGMRAFLSAAIFELSKQNFTTRVVLNNGDFGDQLIQDARVRGFELEGKAEIADNWDIIASYAYVDSEIAEADPVDGQGVAGNAFATVPNHMASLWVNRIVPGTEDRGEMTFGLGARYTGSYYFGLQNTGDKSEATTLFDAAFTYEVTENTGLALNVSNLLDEQHVVGSGTADYYNPGRTITATLRRTW
ncbi:TonB-dependent siderophore receptor [Cereibacter changlensis]|uniref:TonB-dependent siderophore receptor n=2 Tax=Cereibacter changlensis TaxID=402884 RepID=A0A4U0Z4H4_9RHOB|nr:TonB-dependent siderophore receptor [Cereibacter changlensis]